MKKSLLLLAFLTSLSAQAAVFDAADFLPGRTATLGIFGELLLNDPTSEGVEARSRFGLSDDWNVGATIGTGTKNKKLRLGGETVYNFIPDYDGQFGISALASATYIKRATGALQLRVAPLFHKRINGMGGYPNVIYASLPLYLEGRSGNYTTGSQIVVGDIFDFTDNSHYYGNLEGRISLAKSESYILVGAGFRFGELKFQKRERKGGEGGSRKGDDKEYRDEDFNK